jgi:hypothetical protein
VVAAVPYLLGFVPRRSLVVVGVDDDQGVGATLRTDLSTEELRGVPTTARLPAAWDHAVRVLRRNGCTRALVVLYGEVEPDQVPVQAARRLVDLLHHGGGAPGDRSGGGGGGPVRPWTPDRPGRPRPGGTGLVDGDGPAEVLEVLDVLLVGPSRFRSLLCPDPSCCPAEGAAVEATGSHPVAASFVLAGRSPAPGRDDLEPVPRPAEPADCLLATAAVVRSRGLRAGGGADAAPDLVLLEEWLGCLPDGPSPELAGRLGAAWRASPLLRDSCVAAFLPGGAALARRLLGPGHGAGRPGGGGGRPAVSLADSLADPRCSGAVGLGAPVLRLMAAVVPAPESADVVAAHAWLSWASGEGTAAAVLAERALAVDPGQSLARLVLQCLDHGLGAPWTVRLPGARRGSRRLRGLG